MPTLVHHSSSWTEMNAYAICTAFPWCLAAHTENYLIDNWTP